MSLTEKTIVITGSSRGLGKALAIEFQNAGARVVVSSRDVNAAQRALADLPRPNDTLALACDVHDLDQVRALADAAVQKFGTLDVWVNNAGYSHPYGKLREIDPGAWRESFETNLFGTYHGCRAALDAMVPRGQGQIINILGAGAFKAAPNQSGYGASKTAIARLTETLALEYDDTGIKIFSVQPGMIWTEMLTNAQGVDNPRLRARFEWAMRVFGNPPEIPARYIVRRAQEGALNGHVYRVVTTQMYLPRLIGEIFGAGNKNPRPWETR